MKLWLLEPNSNLKPEADPWMPWFDKIHRFVIRARDEKSAREIASEHSRDEQREVWLDPFFSSCTELKPKGDVGIVCQDFRGT
jgi:hypothetical protein